MVISGWAIGQASELLAAKGFPILAEFHKTNLPITSTSLVARSVYIQKNSHLVENFMKAVLEGMAFVLRTKQ